VFLATDASGSNLQLLATFTFNGTLDVDESIDRTQLVTLPDTLSGDRWIVVRTDANNQIAEHEGENNNQGVTPASMEVTLHPYPNLIVARHSVLEPADRVVVDGDERR
jgi:hypothetical protein